MYSRAFSVLMWKHAVVRKRKFINTIIDLVSPLLFILLVFAFRKKLNPQMSDHVQENSVAYTDILPLTDVMPAPYWILYYPDTPLTNSLMEDVGAKLNLKKLEKFDHLEKGYFALANESLVNDTESSVRLLEALVIFQEMSGESWPDRLNYTIRLKGDFQTESYETQDSTPGPHRMFGIKYGTFMRIQWAIDTSYIRLLTGVEVPQSVSLQEFPYYRTRTNQNISSICDLLKGICWLSLMLTFVFHMGRLLQERTSGIQELMKMVGISNNTIWLSHYLNVLPCGLVFSVGGTILLKTTANPLIRNSEGILIFLMLLLYFNTVVSLAFVCSYVSRGTHYAATLSILAYVMLWIPTRLIADRNLSYYLALATGLVPHVPLYWFWNELGAIEMYDNGSNFSNMAKSHAKNIPCVLLSIVFMLLQSVIFNCLAWYLSLVLPGKYGQALPWNFLCKRKEKTREKKRQGKKKKEEMENAESRSGSASSYYPSKYTISRMSGDYSWSCDCDNEPDDDDDDDDDNDNDTQYWSKSEVRPDSESEMVNPTAHDSRYFEPAPTHNEIGIKVVNVSKVYLKHRALRNVSMDVAKGEITVLLGHNGAGKTTLMSIITGMTSASEGKIYVNGKDTVAQKHEVRKSLGLCPQHNLFFDDLTVEEHIIFFTLLKRGTYREARHAAHKLADQISIANKLTSLTSQLSGGMKRRVQLACSLAGGANVLILDEPTSGLDVENRRQLWDLLLSLRGERTVLITTHYMEEADALGDRVAALHNGVLKCFATTMHLKKAVGTGYRLAFTTVGTPNEPAITKALTKHIPDATVKEQTLNSISYNLPATQSRKFSKMFSALENSKSELGIDSIGVGASTLEEVFIKLCSDVDTTLGDDEVDNPDEPEETPDLVKGKALYLRQFLVLLKRQMKFIISKKWSFLIWQVLVPIGMIFVMTKTTCNIKQAKSRSLPMNLDMFSDRTDRRVLYHLELPDVNPAVLKKQYPRVMFQDSDDVAAEVLRSGEIDVMEYNKYLVGVEINETDAKVLYTTTVRHAAPVALNVLTNMLATRFISWADGKVITTVNDPIETDEIALKSSDKPPKGIILLLTWGICITFIMLSTNVNSVSLPCKERSTGARHIHVMSGCAAELYWSATLACHALVCAATLLLPVALAALLLEKDDTINQPQMLATFILILMLGSLAFFAFMYLVSFHFGEKTTSIILVFWIIVFGILFPFIGTAYMIYNEHDGFFYHVAQGINYVATPQTLVNTALSCLYVGRLNAMCKVLRKHCPDLDIFEGGFDSAKCCAGENMQCYFCFSELTPGKGIVTLAVQFIVFMTMVFLTQRGVFNGLTDKLWNLRYRAEEPAQQDEMVRAEKDYVRKSINLPPKQIPDAMLVDDIHKNYVPLCRRRVNAVKGVSFSVKKGECFGLLGVNGAGKSSTFMMLTAEECATKGNIFANGYHLKRGNAQYLQTLGYCPQFFGLDMFLTGEENLSLLLTLRGFDKQMVKKEVRSWISIVGLEQHARQRVAGYSGGCVRRLGAAAALCGRADLALLDEPSAGVDVAARRRLWHALRRALRHERSVVITSHSMDEMEALCSRIAILSGGRVRALGTAPALRSAYGKGHYVVLKVKPARGSDVVDGTNTETNKLKSKLQQTFNCTLKDEHKTMLHYHINDSLKYSNLFSQLEALQAEFPTLIEDYSVTDTTLEEVFLSFAKEQQTGLRANP